jgi:ABC-type dipeptide/oligopeptide/nickel transport system permease subunit
MTDTTAATQEAGLGGPPSIVDSSQPMSRPATAGDGRPAKVKPGFGFWLSVFWVVLLGGAALFASVLPIKASDATDFAKRNERPSFSIHEPLGRDQFGRSELSRVIYGARVSLAIGLGAAALGAVVGGTLGLIAGYARGWGDSLVSMLADAMLAFPPLILLIALVAVLPKTATARSPCPRSSVSVGPTPSPTRSASSSSPLTVSV